MHNKNNTQSMSGKKKQPTVTLDDEVRNYLQQQIKEKRFSSVSHGVNYAVYRLMKEENK